MSTPSPVRPVTAEAAARSLGQPVCLDGTAPALGFLHQAASPREVAVLLCPPFGWDELCSYRARRIWAAELAAAGLTALRIDLPGCGDSPGSPTDPSLLDAWTAAVTEAGAWLRAHTGARRVAAVGLGLGGMVAWRAAAQGGPIDDLVLWGVPDQGRRLVRELRAYAGTVAGRYVSRLPALELPDGGADVSGFLLSGETLRGLEELTLSELPLPDAAQRRVLLIGRDGLGADRRLQAHLEQAQVELTVAAGADFADLVAHPQQGRLPRTTMQTSIEWLVTAPGPEPQIETTPAPPVARAEFELVVDGERIREAPLLLPSLAGESVGILAGPAQADPDDVCVVFLNAGAIRRIGPNRTWVEAARRWAARGTVSVRMDCAGVGDSQAAPGADFSDREMYSPELARQVGLTLDALQARGIAERFVLVGLCSGAYWAARTALTDHRVIGVLLLNLYAFEWSPQLVAERDRLETAAALRSGLVRRVVRGGIRRHHLERAWRSLRTGGLPRPRRAPAPGGSGLSTGLALSRLGERGVETLLLFSDGEPLLSELERDGLLEQAQRWPTVEIRRLPSTDHNVRALALQRLVHLDLDRGLERALAALPSHRPTPAG